MAEATYRSAVKMAHEALRAFKRDLQNLGMTRPQIFDIIPDGTPAASKSEGAGPSDGAGSPPAAPTTNPKAA